MMKIKKVILAVCIAASQAAIVMPAYAESANEVQDKQVQLDGFTNRLVLYLNSRKMEQNGLEYTAIREATVKQGITYVSLRSITDRLGYKVEYDANTNEALVSGGEVFGARFKANRNTYILNGASYPMNGTPYMDDGVLMLPLRSLSAAYGLKITLEGSQAVLEFPAGTTTDPEPEPQRNEPPVALFATDKHKYRIGEFIRYDDQSTDDEDAIVERKWDNNEPAFFQPGIVEVTLQVTDKHGLSSTYKQQIEITSELLYTKEEFDRLFTPVGSNFEIAGGSVLSFDALPYTYRTEPYTLFRASGPETVNYEGILYQDTIEGTTLFMIHHKNDLGEKAKFYVVAENQGEAPASVKIGGLGFAGPSIHPEVAGRLAAARYFESMISGSAGRSMTLVPGEKKLIFTELSAAAVPNGDVVTLNGDLVSDGPIQYTVLIVKANHDPLEMIAALPYLDPKESIIRGTFQDSARVFEYNGLVGTKPERLPLTDNTTDPFQKGIDGIKLTEATNSGNYGVLYYIVLNRVAPNTLITFNPRGGLYSGAARVNNDVIHIKHIGSTKDSTSVLYRTGDQEEKVELWITPAAGSNLPFTFLFLPLPEARN
ncbi:copper amine oxidase N-terminal domain-containing protein [Paenibacillus woosongensis]|uniref:Copper amine oxidase N-terminal domain-containing protein n=1 Tax=Paenibacillus woosongensis TaxID=307580 RepID=A0A7X2YXW9_9BACL|nr:copper amine oxidase N-terminal domain-containing protein [Paenibacillus woosongensis]MUG43820.1 copper amine oxidase N-terminal domain-containing protein [Paenibacillus woosongensis]